MKAGSSGTPGERSRSRTSIRRAQRKARGVFVVLVGPDGVGKTTAASAVGGLHAGMVRYFHFRPPVLGSLCHASDVERQPPPMEKADKVVWRPIGWARLAVAFVRFWLGYLVTVRPALARGELVIGDRWAYPYLVQPTAVRFGGPEGMARVALALLPQPDVVVNLSAPPLVIRARKDELTITQIEYELREWAHLPTRALHTVDATSDPHHVASEILRLAGVAAGHSDDEEPRE